MRLYSKLFTIGWNVAYKKKNEKKYTVIKNNINSWTADPFVFEYKGDVYIFGEVYDYKRWKGSIGFSKLVNGSFSKWETVIKENYHLSFPNIKIEDNNIYIYAESSENNSFYRYKAVDFPYVWKKDKCLAKNTKIVDSDIFKYNDEKYLMTYDINDVENKKLLLFKINKDKIDFDTKQIINTNDSEARLAGKIQKNKDKYIRVAQDCGDFYGKALKFFEFTIDNNIYKEKLLKEVLIKDIKINGKNKFFGVHTYNTSDEYEVIDLKFKRVLIMGLLGKIIRKVRTGK